MHNFLKTFNVCDKLLRNILSLSLTHVRKATLNSYYRLSYMNFVCEENITDKAVLKILLGQYKLFFFTSYVHAGWQESFRLQTLQIAKCISAYTAKIIFASEKSAILYKI